MHKEQIQQYKKRVELFLNRLPDATISDSIPLSAKYSRSELPVSFENRNNREFSLITEGEAWGDSWDSAWFHLTGTVPKEWHEQLAQSNLVLAARLDFNGEGLIFDDEGTPIYGITNGSVFTHRNNGKDIYRLPGQYKGGENIDIWVETAANHLFGVLPPNASNIEAPQKNNNYKGVVNHIKLVLFDEMVWHLWLDIDVLIKLQNKLPQESPRAKRLLSGINDAIDVYADNSANAEICRNMLKPLWTNANASDLVVTATGHAHIDTGWLWPVKETIRKCARTFASQIALFERYPDYIFGASSPQHYLFVKEHYPELYRKIKQYVKEGRWELQGGMWVEADCNIISGESMVRQILHGKNFFMDEFGEDVKNLWIPDVFGYSAAMPQILQKSGVTFFLTQKISWNQYNKFPYHLFNWKGIDGTSVVTHFLPENNYNSAVTPESLIAAQERFNENNICDEMVSLYGIGNGGGGPKEEFIERGIRMQNLEGCPKWRFGKAQDAFERMSVHTEKLPYWSGELYLECHRGTLTTQSLMKKYNRTLESRLRTVEFIYSCLDLDLYPQEELDALWKNVLLNQFHDIIPGSSIKMVYDTVYEESKLMLQKCNQLLAQAERILFTEDSTRITLVNVLSCEFTAPITLPSSWSGYEVMDKADVQIPTQYNNDKTEALAVIPSLGTLTLIKGKKIHKFENISSHEARQNDDTYILENDLISYTISRNGTVESAFDKEAGREVLRAPGNVLSLYVDRPNVYDAWEVDIFYENELTETAVCTDVKSCNSGLIKSTLTLNLTIGNSTIRQVISLAAGSKRIDFDTTVDWLEDRRMLRVSFPVAIQASEASCDIQYGFVKRPTHRNTSWDMAKFEVAAHKFADISDAGYGVALLNNCKYGYKVLENTLDLNLLRSPKYPDPEADMHTHSFTYSLLPHTGALIASSVQAESLMLNNPPVIFEGKQRTAENQPLEVPCYLKSEGISLEVIKKAEKEDCLIIRLVETFGMQSSGTLLIADSQAKLVETNLMEWSEGSVISADNPIELTLSPFEIRTYKIKR